MRGIEIFLVTKENGKDVCYMELTECEYDTNTRYNIMRTFKSEKSGISLVGKIEEKELIEKQLKDYYRKEISDEIKELKKRLKFLEKAKIESECVFGI